jgi:hypothetical protein
MGGACIPGTLPAYGSITRFVLPCAFHTLVSWDGQIPLERRHRLLISDVLTHHLHNNPPRHVLPPPCFGTSTEMRFECCVSRPISLFALFMTD